MIHEFSEVNALGMRVARFLRGKLTTSVRAELWYPLKRLSHSSNYKLAFSSEVFLSCTVKICFVLFALFEN